MASKHDIFRDKFDNVCARLVHKNYKIKTNRYIVFIDQNLQHF